MKKTTKWIAAATIAGAIFFATNVKAQTTPANAWRFGIGLETGIPTGVVSNIRSNFVIGGTGRLQYGVTNSFAITLTSGYYDFVGRNSDVFTSDQARLGLIPLKAGIKAFFAPNVYFGAEAGAGFGTNSNGHTKAIFAPALGWANKSWDVGLRYENISGQDYNYGLVGLRIAYGFGL